MSKISVLYPIGFIISLLLLLIAIYTFRDIAVTINYSSQGQDFLHKQVFKSHTDRTVFVNKIKRIDTGCTQGSRSFHYHKNKPITLFGKEMKLCTFEVHSYAYEG